MIGKKHSARGRTYQWQYGEAGSLTKANDGHSCHGVFVLLGWHGMKRPTGLHRRRRWAYRERGPGRGLLIWPRRVLLFPFLFSILFSIP